MLCLWCCFSIRLVYTLCFEASTYEMKKEEEERKIINKTIASQEHTTIEVATAQNQRCAIFWIDRSLKKNVNEKTIASQPRMKWMKENKSEKLSLNQKKKTLRPKTSFGFNQFYYIRNCDVNHICPAEPSVSYLCGGIWHGFVCVHAELRMWNERNERRK